jgi:phenylacetate-CoA ligase
MNNLNNFLFKLKNSLFRPKAVQQYNEAIHNCSLTSEQLQNLNWKKRKAIVMHAYNNTAFYKRYYDSMGFNPDMLQTESDWDKVPVLEKKMVREFREEIKDNNIKSKYVGVATTGGSTGLPLKIYTDKRFNNEVLGWRAFQWWNVSPAANVGIVHRRTPTTFSKKFLNRTLWWPTKRIYLNASSISENELKRFTSDICKYRIVWLQGYVGALERVADYILKNNLKINTLKLIWSTAAPLHKNTRIKLEKAFNCKIMNQYGCNEVANIAIQCPHGNDLHINYDCVHMDVVDKIGQSIVEEEGDILVTNLYSYVFPLIKYRLGDKGALSTNRCICGNLLPLLKEVKGRISDAVYTPDGLYIDGDYLTTVFDNYTEFIDQFQIYQKSDYSVIVYVKLYDKNDETIKIVLTVKQIIEQNVKNKVPVTIEIVDSINDDKGKIRYIISEVALSKIQSANQ